jgi:hypothetical protein
LIKPDFVLEVPHIRPAYLFRLDPGLFWGKENQTDLRGRDAKCPQTTMSRVGIGCCYRCRPCWNGGCRLFLALAFPLVLVSVWRANFLLPDFHDPRLVLDHFAHHRHAPRGEAVPVNTVGAAQLTNVKSSSPLVASRGRAPSRYAYVFLMGFCDPDQPAYKPYIGGVSVAAHLLRKYGSRQDMVLYIMMSEFSKHPTLPAEDLRICTALNVTVRQIPTVSTQTFHRLQLQKFRALGLAQYKRVMFLDCDVMPLANLDVMFENSDPDVYDPPLLKENLIFVDYVVPSNGGIWMLAPHAGDLERVNDLIREAQLVRNQGIEGREPWRRFTPQPWESLSRTSNEYDFYAVSGDQGLLFSWVRHYQRTYSHVVKGGAIVNYIPDESDDQAVRVESTIKDPHLPRWDIWPADTDAWGTNRSQLVGTHANYGHGGAFQCCHHFINFIGKPWYDEGCVGSSRWDKATNPVREGSDIDERASRFWCQSFVEMDAMYNSTVRLSDLHNVPPGYYKSDPIRQLQWATEGPITNLLEPDFDPRDLREPNPTK